MISPWSRGRVFAHAAPADLRKDFDGLSALVREHLGAGRARITHSIYAALRGRNDDALRLSAEGLARIEPMQDPVLIMTALHNRLLLALRLGARDEVRRTLALCRGIGTIAGEPSSAVALRLRWIEGQALQVLGELESAEIALRQSRDGLAALGLGEPQPFSTRV